MFKTRLLPSVIFTVFFGSTEAFAASELQQMRATLGEMQKLLQQQQARIEQLEKQASERRPPALTAAEPAAKPLVVCLFVCRSMNSPLRSTEGLPVLQSGYGVVWRPAVLGRRPATTKDR